MAVMYLDEERAGAEFGARQTMIMTAGIDYRPSTINQADNERQDMDVAPRRPGERETLKYACST